MAYGFGSTYGTNTADTIEIPTHVPPALVTRHCWVNAHGTGGGGLGTVYRSSIAGAVRDDLFRRPRPNRAEPGRG